MSQPLSSSDQAAVDAALQSGRKIEAVKLYREATGASLKDAKDAVDAREVVLRGTAPANFEVQEGGGCTTGVVAVLLVLTGLIVIGFLALLYLG